LGGTRLSKGELADDINDSPPGEVQTSYTIVALNDVGDAIKDTLNHMEDITLHTGVRTGLTLSKNTDTTFDVAAGTAIIVNRDPDPTDSLVTRITKTAQSGITDTNLGEALSHIFMDSAGTITVETSPPQDIADVFDRIYLGALVHVSNIIVSTVPDPIVAHCSSATEIVDLVFGGGTKLDGSLLSANGANLTMDITAGILRQLGRGFVPNPNSPNEVATPASTPVVTADFFLVFINGSGQLIGDNTSNVIDPAQINLDGDGTLTSVGMNNFSVIRVFQAGITNDLIFYYGTIAFATIDAAQANAEPTWVEHEDTRDISPIAKIYVRGNVTDLAAAITAGDAIIEPIISRTQLQ